MKIIHSLFLFLLCAKISFAQSGVQKSIFLQKENTKTIAEHFPPPEGFRRITLEQNSFGAWLRNLPLLPENSPVKDYRNKIFKKSGDSTVAAVVAYNITGRKLDQCMDILMRFYSEYLIQNNRLNEIQFPLPDGLILSWNDWSEGQRPYFRGLHFYLSPTALPDSSCKNFQSYLNTLFEYSGTQAFYHYFKTIPRSEIKVGDFIVKKGAQGHAVLIVDLAQNAKGNLVALVGQGDTPACGFYLLKAKDGNPWFPIQSNSTVLPLPIKKKMSWDGLRRFGYKKKSRQN